MGELCSICYGSKELFGRQVGYNKVDPASNSGKLTATAWNARGASNISYLASTQEHLTFCLGGRLQTTASRDGYIYLWPLKGTCSAQGKQTAEI